MLSETMSHCSLIISSKKACFGEMGHSTIGGSDRDDSKMVLVAGIHLRMNKHMNLSGSDFQNPEL